MFRSILLLLLITAPVVGFGQGAPSVSSVPPIDLVLTDGQKFTNQNLKQGPFVLVYFSPDCGHCKQFITALLQREKLARSKPILLASFVEINTLKSFEEAIGLGKFSNIKMGTEGGSYLIARGLSIRKFPFIALYDASHKLVRTFEGEQPMTQIAEAIGTL